MIDPWVVGTAAILCQYCGSEIAAISDLHGNHGALDAVLSDAARRALRRSIRARIGTSIMKIPASAGDCVNCVEVL